MEGSFNRQIVTINNKICNLTLNGNENTIQINENIDNLFLNGCENKVFISATILNLLINGNSNSINSENVNSSISIIMFNGMKNKVTMNVSNVSNMMKFDNGTDNFVSFNPDQRINSSTISRNVIFTQIIINNNFNDFSSQLETNITNIRRTLGNFPNMTFSSHSDQTNNPNNYNEFLQRKIEVVNNLEKAKYSNYKRKKKSIKQDLCAICLEKYKSKDILIVFACKQHIFHQNCLYEWLQNSNYCPLCKLDIIEFAL